MAVARSNNSPGRHQIEQHRPQITGHHHRAAPGDQRKPPEIPRQLLVTPVGFPQFKRLADALDMAVNPMAYPAVDEARIMD